SGVPRTAGVSTCRYVDEHPCQPEVAKALIGRVPMTSGVVPDRPQQQTQYRPGSLAENSAVGRWRDLWNILVEAYRHLQRDEGRRRVHSGGAWHSVVVDLGKDRGRKDPGLGAGQRYREGQFLRRVAVVVDRSHQRRAAIGAEAERQRYLA